MSNVLFLEILRQLYEISIVKEVVSNGTSFIWVSTPEIKGCTFLLAFHFSFSQVLAVFPRLLIHFHSNTSWGTNSTKKYSPFKTLSQTNDLLTKWVCCERRCWLGIVFFFRWVSVFSIFFYYITLFEPSPTPRNYQRAHVNVFALTKRHTYFFIFFLCHFLLAWRVVIRRVFCFLKNDR